MNISVLALAYMGDAVFEILVREKLVRLGIPVNELHMKAKEYVSAAAQSEMYHKIEELLTEEEKNVLRRGRNAKSNSRSKNADVTQYRHATGLEAVFGHLHLKGEKERIEYIFGKCTDE